MKPDISGLSDRQLLEQVYAMQLLLMQKLYGMKDLTVKKYNADVEDEEGQNDETIDKIQDDVNRLLNDGYSGM